jgi:hypothetical protein
MDRAFKARSATGREWRIIFEAERDAIIVWSIAHRREVYRSEP